ncbi:MAG: hypothetical protein IMW93_06160 [Thermoanaerobacteraceae bacterium]|nr:hypothetical protein [Thermoanaerobacteraceae bacterium]
MENARLLEERLKRIIREISADTGREIKKDLLGQLEQEVKSIIHQHSRQELNRFLNLVKRAADQI